VARRLPIYFVLDVSESMVGEPIKQMESVIDHVLADLRRDPHALESVWFSEIVFAAKAKTLNPLQEISTFTPNSLPIGGGTGIGAMLSHLMNTLDQDRRTDGATGKADWKPIVYLMTDGRSTDGTDAEVSRWRQSYKDKCIFVAISIGAKSDFDLLRRITDNVLVFMDSNPESYSGFAKWISRSIGESIKVASSSVNSTERPIARFEEGLVESIEHIDLSKHSQDEHTLVIPGKCQETSAAYLLKYETGTSEQSNSGEIAFRGSIPLRDTYFELSAAGANSSEIDIQALETPGRCVNCGADHALVICAQCKKISCGRSDQAWKCPWCGLNGQLEALEGPSYTERGLG
jgi:uncharacterized protein YegL